MSTSRATRSIPTSASTPAVPQGTPARGIVARTAVLVALAVAVAGAGMSGYLGFENLQGESGVCTGVAHGCATVQQSPYGKILGVPVSVIGLAGYVSLAGLAVVWLTNYRGLRALSAFLAFNGTLAGLLFSGYLTYLEAFVIDAWCIYCITSASLMSLLFVSWSLVLHAEVRAARRGVG